LTAAQRLEAAPGARRMCLPAGPMQQ
jgi:hypothetical protein